MGILRRSVRASGDGGCKAQGLSPGLFYFKIFFVALFALSPNQAQANSEDQSLANPKVKINPRTQTEESMGVVKNRRRVEFLTYVPQKVEYLFDLGSMWERDNLYWMSAGLGWHVGRCVLSDSQTCQQYWEALAGVAGRDGQTNGLILTGPRWQFVNYPSSFSPYVKALGGVMNFQDERRTLRRAVGLIGLGGTISVHERVDVRIEGRMGYSDEILSQLFFGFNIKIDLWVDYFSEKINKLKDSTKDIFR